MLRPGVIVAERHFPGVLFLVFAMTEPVMNHELHPRGYKQVDRGCWLEGLAREQLATDSAWVRYESVWLLRIDVCEGDIATEACMGAAHRGVIQIIISSVRRTGGDVALIPCACCRCSLACCSLGTLSCRRLRGRGYH